MRGTLWQTDKKNRLRIVVEESIATGEVIELRVFTQERETNRTNRPVTLLTDDDFGRTLVW